MKIGHRIRQLDSMLQQEYDDIWDCCCDHGLLGMLLLEKRAAKTIHFVDINAKLIDQLAQKLNQYFPLNTLRNRWQVHCANVAMLDLTAHAKPNDRHLVIIAGVGGERTIELLDSLISRHQDFPVEFLLCPVYGIYPLRQALINWQLGLINEIVIEEKQRFYEIIHVAKNANQAISPVGSMMWNQPSLIHRQYLQQTIAFYQRNAQDPKKQVSEMLNAYQDKLAELETPT